MFRIRKGFIAPFNIRITKDDAGRARIDEPPYPFSPAGVQDMLRPRNIGPIEGGVITPNAGFGGIVKNDGAAGAGVPDGLTIREIAPQDRRTQVTESWIIPPGKATHTISLCQETFDKGAPKKSASSGNKDLLFSTGFYHNGLLYRPRRRSGINKLVSNSTAKI
jgi:hypothetical protein